MELGKNVSDLLDSLPRQSIVTSIKGSIRILVSFSLKNSISRSIWRPLWDSVRNLKHLI